MNQLNSNLLSLIPAFDVVVAILATLYISVAIFAAQNIFKTGPEAELNVSGRHYIKLLRFTNISLLLISIPILVRLGNINWLNGDYQNSKAPLLIILLFTLTIIVIGEIRAIITQRALNGKLTTGIQHPNLKFAAWLIANEKDWTIEKRDLIASSLTSFNKSSIPFEQFILKVIEEDTDKLLSADIKQREQGEFLVSLLSILKDNWEKRPLAYPDYINKLFEYLFNSWKRINKDSSLYSAGGVYNLRLSFLHCINSLSKFCLGASALSYDFFVNLTKYLNSLDENEVRKFLVNFDDKIFFEHIPQSPESYMIWEDSFPTEWKLTYTNLVEKPNPVAANIFRRFLDWSQNRFFRDENIDTDLDEVAANLFPEVDQIHWARLLEYRFAPWAGNEHLRYIISKTSTFGFGKSYSVHDYVDDATTIKNMLEEDKVRLKATVKLATGLGLFSKKYVDQVIVEANDLEKDKSLTDRERRKLSQHKDLFTEIGKVLEESKPAKKKRAGRRD